MAKELGCPCGFTIRADAEDPLLNAMQCHMTWHGRVLSQQAIDDLRRNIKNV